jgi:hypothetical protein
MLDEIWKSLRWARHQVLGVERRTRQIRQFQAVRAKEQLARAAGKEPAGQSERSVTPLEELKRLQGIVDASVEDVDAIVCRPATDLEHNRALEGALEVQEQFDRLINAANARRNNALDFLETYRAALGSEESETQRLPQIEAPELALSSGDHTGAETADAAVSDPQGLPRTEAAQNAKPNSGA